MGTRGLMAFAYDGEVKGMYNHFDSYPSGLGQFLVKFLIGQAGDYTSAKERIKNLTAVDEDTAPTEDQKLALLRYYDPKVSTGSTDEWYALLRETQGDPSATLNAGFYLDGLDFAHDSLFCEWGYVLDFDREVVEVYQGFQKSPATAGRFAADNRSSSSGYHSINLIKEFTFAELLEDPIIMSSLEDELDEDEDY